MLFNSYLFVFLFFPICLLGYYGLWRAGKPGPARVFLIAMSLWFYGYFNLSYLLIMVCSIGVNFLFHRLLSGEKEREGGTGKPAMPRKALVILAVACNLGVLFYFKYFDFFLSTVNEVFDASFALRGILLPLGISFFTFQQISFVVDTYRGEVKNCPLDAYALFVSFFPQLIAGPIVNHSEMLPQFERIGEKKPDWEQIAGGFALFVLGLSTQRLSFSFTRCSSILISAATVIWRWASAGCLVSRFPRISARPTRLSTSLISGKGGILP